MLLVPLFRLQSKGVTIREKNNIKPAKPNLDIPLP